MEYVESGVVEQVLYSDITTKDGKNIPKVTCVIRLMSDKTKILAVDFFNYVTADLFIDITIGVPVVLSFSCYSREYNGKYYHTIKGKSIERYLGVPMEKKMSNFKKKVDDRKKLDDMPVMPKQESSRELTQKYFEDQGMKWEDAFSEEETVHKEPDF